MNNNFEKPGSIEGGASERKELRSSFERDLYNRVGKSFSDSRNLSEEQLLGEYSSSKTTIEEVMDMLKKKGLWEFFENFKKNMLDKAFSANTVSPEEKRTKEERAARIVLLEAGRLEK